MFLHTVALMKHFDIPFIGHYLTLKHLLIRYVSRVISLLMDLLLSCC